MLGHPQDASKGILLKRRRRELRGEMEKEGGEGEEGGEGMEGRT